MSEENQSAAPDTTTIREELMQVALSLAVPLWIEKLRGRPWEYLAERARACGQIVAEQGDVVQFRQRGKTKEAFNRLAEGLACLSFAPGGVEFMGMRFDANPAPRGPAG